MKKILLFLFGIFLITTKVYASDSTFYKITFHQHAEGVTHSGLVGKADIKTGKYELIDLDQKMVISILSSNTNFGTNLPNNTSFNLKEVSSSLGYYENIPLNINFDLNKTCNHITIDIEKRIKEYNLKIENKTNSNNYYYLYDSNNKTIKYNTKLLNSDELVVKYDNYRFKTSLGMIDFNIADLNTYKDGIILDNDSLRITMTEIKLETPYEPIVNVVKTCTNSDGSSYDEKIDLKKDIEKENNQNDEINQETIETLLHNSSILETNEVNESIDITEPVSIENPSINAVTDVTIKDNSIRNSVIKKTNVKTSKLNKKDNLVKVSDIKEDLESNLIITYNDKTDYHNQKIKYKKASNIPLFITIFLPIIIFLVVKIVKKVRKI